MRNRKGDAQLLPEAHKQGKKGLMFLFVCKGKARAKSKNNEMK
jgi:hypothetical protein